jgi:hypothetical protein
MVIGGQAVLYYGEPRLTKDIDITLGITVEESIQVFKIIKSLKLRIITKQPLAFARRTMILPVQEKSTGIRIDFIFSFSPYERQAIRNAKTVKIRGVAVKIASLEDVVVHKIIAGRARDIDDVKSIILKNRKYNQPYIIRWLKKFDRALGGGYASQFVKIKKEIS